MWSFPAVKLALSTEDDNVTLTPLQPAQTHCNPGALTDTFGFMIQLALGGIAFAFLIIKRYCESKETRRAWWVWAFDTSKQIIASFVTHFGNVFISEYAKGDPCSWYFINFLVDSTAGLVIIFFGLRLAAYLTVRFGLTLLQSGEYGNSRKQRIKAFVGQTFVYCVVSTIEKALTASFMVAIWKPMQSLVIWPHVNPKLEVAVVLLIVPFVVNVIVFWIIDNLLMRKRKKQLADLSEEVLVSNPRNEAPLDWSASSRSDSVDDYEPLMRASRGFDADGGSTSRMHSIT